MGRVNRICLCLNADTLTKNLAWLQAEEHFDPFLDLAELRLDFMLDFSSATLLENSLQKLCQDLRQELKQHYSIVPLQLVLTLRKFCDGGLCPDFMPDNQYLTILQRCLAAIPKKYLAYIDLDSGLLHRNLGNFQREQKNIQDVNHSEIVGLIINLFRQLQDKNAGLIVSVHNFGSFPGIEEIQRLWNDLEKLPLPADTIQKFAFMVSNSQELLNFYRVACHIRNFTEKPCIFLAMGEVGSSSRVLSAHIGNEWTFCSSLKSREAVAPGQFSLNELVGLYNYRHITAETRIYGVIGKPISHSRSPEIHNSIYQKKKWNAVYLRFCVDELSSFLALRDFLPIWGISCTVPHKEALAKLAIGYTQPVIVSEAVRLLGACNTFYRLLVENPLKESQWVAENTDVQGFIQPLLRFCAERSLCLNGQKAAIIGAGGAARAALYALLSQGIDCEVYNRTQEKAEKLKMQFNSYLPGKIIKVASLAQGASISANCSLLVQTTSVGMRDTEDPIPEYQFRAGQIAYDIIYQPEYTSFLRRAERAGALVLNGRTMLEMQAMAQIELFGQQCDEVL